jgi:hypothetical protein
LGCGAGEGVADGAGEGIGELVGPGAGEAVWAAATLAITNKIKIERDMVNGMALRFIDVIK